MTDYQNNAKSVDITSMEGIAAQHYWKYLIGNGFYGKDLEILLISFNFGYSVLRSMVARAIVETGLLPVMGIFHKNKYNPYCLADDLMEPYRPFVDILVMQWLQTNPEAEELTKEFKAYLLQIATKDVKIDGKDQTFAGGCKTTASSSLYKCYTGENV